MAHWWRGIRKNEKTQATGGGEAIKGTMGEGQTTTNKDSNLNGTSWGATDAMMLSMQIEARGSEERNGRDIKWKERKEGWGWGWMRGWMPAKGHWNAIGGVGWRVRSYAKRSTRRRRWITLGFGEDVGVKTGEPRGRKDDGRQREEVQYD
ncbi:hypothetical protein GALMADRAFT_210486 [Galerina marginata CBS 339.88]|uniref:Uncharacterized protein n=1 Tax=Galerina marginata (strain CBS 339.88) TaxID=685588 RepID=A0A067T2I7_GALM3|nr:hypothetical protein GALMADRAFT_210486 [Galerina marginata CBS 339.88]